MQSNNLEGLGGRDWVEPALRDSDWEEGAEELCMGRDLERSDPSG